MKNPMELLKSSIFTLFIIKIAYTHHWNDDFDVKQDTKRSLVCRTISGDQPNANCVFPFSYRDTVYRECITNRDPRPWCATRVDFNGNYVRGQWGYCDPNCGRNFKTSPDQTSSASFDTCNDAALCSLMPATSCTHERVAAECPKLCRICQQASSKAPSYDEYNRARRFLRSIMTGDNIPAAVRLAFHDCVGPDGCDGCINPKEPADNGLQPIIKLLVDARNENFPSISNADFWQIAGIVALKNANERMNLDFVGGRPDCPTSPETSVFAQFPNPNMTRSQMMTWFRDNESGFGMGERDVTALMGAHSLGRARKENGGYKFSWTPTKEHIFDNEYYQLMYNFAPMYLNQNQNDIGPDKKYQWVVKLPRGQTFMFLNTDMELLYDIDVDNAGTGTQCTIPLFESEKDKIALDGKLCKEAASKRYVVTYAHNEERFLDDFKHAYEIMMTRKIQANLEAPK